MTLKRTRPVEGGCSVRAFRSGAQGPGPKMPDKHAREDSLAGTRPLPRFLDLLGGGGGGGSEGCGMRGAPARAPGPFLSAAPAASPQTKVDEVLFKFQRQLPGSFAETITLLLGTNVDI